MLNEMAATVTYVAFFPAHEGLPPREFRIEACKYKTVRVALWRDGHPFTGDSSVDDIVRDVAYLGLPKSKLDRLRAKIREAVELAEAKASIAARYALDSAVQRH